MAMTATLAASPTTVNAGVQPTPGSGLQGTLGSATVVTLTVSNSAAGTAVEVIGIRPFVTRSGATQPFTSCAIGQPVLNAANQAVPAGGSSTFTFGVDFYSPQVAGSAGGSFMPANQAYDIGCEVTCADGTVIYPAVATVTVNPSPHS